MSLLSANLAENQAYSVSKESTELGVSE